MTEATKHKDVKGTNEALNYSKEEKCIQNGQKMTTKLRKRCKIISNTLNNYQKESGRRKQETFSLTRRQVAKTTIILISG